ncbi:MAG: universal stress protein [Halioglobus sp.]|nr:universal stress protein [Halioglobus sp.]
MGRMLIIADLEETCCATPRGLELAARLGLEVEVVAFTYVSLASLRGNSAEQARVRKRLLDTRRDEVQAQIDSQRRPGQQVTLQVVWQKDIDQWITRECGKGKVDLVVKTGHRSETLVHTSTDWQLLRECPVPVLLVARKRWHRTKPVLAALDLSTTLRSKQALNGKVLRAARDLAHGLGVELKIITAIEIPTLLADLDLVDPLAYTRDARRDMQPQIDKLAAAYDLPEHLFVSKQGPVEKVITSCAASTRAQIVVMGTVARRGVKARLLGNTAERVLRHMKTDVLAIKP